LKISSCISARLRSIYRNFFPVFLSSALADTKSDPLSEWQTTVHTSVSAEFANSVSIWEAVRYVLRRDGITTAQLKQLSFVFRKEFLVVSCQGLVKYAKKHTKDTKKKNINNFQTKKKFEELFQEVNNIGLMDFPFCTDKVIKLKDLAIDELIIDHYHKKVEMESLKHKVVGLFFSKGDM